MDYLLYIVPIAVFIFLVFSFYYSLEPEQKDYYKILIPSTITAVAVFLILKYKPEIEPEPMMFGGYFD